MSTRTARSPHTPIAGGAIEGCVDFVIDRDRGAAAAGEMQQIVEAPALRAVMRERPELGRERTRRRLEQQRQVDVVGAEAHAVFAQAGALGLFQPLHVVGDPLPVEHAERFDQLERDAARDAGDVGRGREFEQRAEQLLDVRLEPVLEPRLDRFARRARKDARRQ